MESQTWKVGAAVEVIYMSLGIMLLNKPSKLAPLSMHNRGCESAQIECSGWYARPFFEMSKMVIVLSVHSIINRAYLGTPSSVMLQPMVLSVPFKNKICYGIIGRNSGPLDTLAKVYICCEKAKKTSQFV